MRVFNHKKSFGVQSSCKITVNFKEFVLRSLQEHSRDSGIDSMARTPSTGVQSSSAITGTPTAESSTTSSRHSLPYRPGASILPPRPASRVSSDTRQSQNSQLRYPLLPPASLDSLRCRGGSLKHLVPPSKSMSGLSIASSSSASPSPCRSASVGSIQRASPSMQQSGLQPLTSYRLRPMRTITRMAVINILADESVCLEFFDSRCADKEKLVVEVMGISVNGQEVVLYCPNGGRGVRPNADTPIVAGPGDTYMVYPLAQLPEKYWKKYQFVSK